MGAALASPLTMAGAARGLGGLGGLQLGRGAVGQRHIRIVHPAIVLHRLGLGRLLQALEHAIGGDIARLAFDGGGESMAALARGEATPAPAHLALASEDATAAVNAAVALARAVHEENDRRAALKRAINEASGSALVEEKSYASG